MPISKNKAHNPISTLANVSIAFLPLQLRISPHYLNSTMVTPVPPSPASPKRIFLTERWFRRYS